VAVNSVGVVGLAARLLRRGVLVDPGDRILGTRVPASAAPPEQTHDPSLLFPCALFPGDAPMATRPASNPPVEPKPSAPRAEPGSPAPSTNAARPTRCTTSCAIRSPRRSTTGVCGSVFSRVTWISPRYPQSTVPGAFTTVSPCRAARPDLGCTNP